MLSNSCLVLPAVVKKQQEEISRNHVPSLFAVSVKDGLTFQFDSVIRINYSSSQFSSQNSSKLRALNITHTHTLMRCVAGPRHAVTRQCMESCQDYGKIIPSSHDVAGGGGRNFLKNLGGESVSAAERRERRILASRL